MRLSKIKLHQDVYFLLVIYSLNLIVGAVFLSDYLIWDSQWLLALVLVPLVAQVQPGRVMPGKLFLAVIVTAALSAYLHNATLYFFAFALVLWCAAQLMFGRIRYYPLILLLTASPIFKYVSNILSFPLRLQLSDWAAAILNFSGQHALAAGNIILLDGNEFSVDPACAGLSMLSLSMLVAVFIMAHFQKTKGKKWPGWLILAMLGAMLLLNILANLTRILLLVWFQIMPGNPIHDVVGILCLLFYALVPFYFLAKNLHKLSGKSVSNSPQKNKISFRGALLLNYFLLLLLVGTGLLVDQKNQITTQNYTPQFAGFKAEKLENGVTKLTSPEALVYLKPIQAFYSTEHHPLICWEGSGYTFRQVHQQKIGNLQVYMGELQKGKDKLYTAWWMDNGQHRTTDQWDWRWRMLKGESNFNLVNVTVEDKTELEEKIMSLMRQSGRLALKM